MEQQHEPSAFGTLAAGSSPGSSCSRSRVIALKIVFGIVAGLVMAILWAVLLVGLASSRRCGPLQRV